MARRILVAGAVAWLVVAALGVAAATGWRDELLAALPVLAIDADAVGGAITVISIGALAIGTAHAAVAAGLGRRRRWAMNGGILLASVLGAAFLTLAAAAATSALRESVIGLHLAAGAVAAAFAALGYGVTAARLIGELRSGSAI